MLKSGFVTLGVIGILTVIISIFYYLKVVVSLYMRPPEAPLAIPTPDLSVKVADGIMLFLLFWLGVAPGALLAAVARIVAALPALV